MFLVRDSNNLIRTTAESEGEGLDPVKIHVYSLSLPSSTIPMRFIYCGSSVLLEIDVAVFSWDI